ncbi:cupin domain-containing protein [Mesorhizobium sp. ANAO-SY3R2]|uniref:cupin domain-containing protein n=1 Tax=Mesorhizobium sp. ANAO-SY3R2 TaxID=3166644 RepID=UPI0036712A87
MSRNSPDFIFMLTNQDRTVVDAIARLKDVLAAGVMHVGFKDIGLPFNELVSLSAAIKAAGATLYLEVVSLDEESERKSAQAAVDLGVDILMGGTRPEVVLPIIADKKIGYYPFPGKIVGHPSKLEGTIETIVESARQLTAIDGVSGIDLLAYRFDGNVEELMARVCQAVDKPVVIAGSIDNTERLETVAMSGASGFTIGTAAFNGAFSGSADLQVEIETVVSALDRIMAEAREHKVDKINLTSAFSKFSDFWAPKIVGDVNDMQIKLAKFRGAFHWHHHEHEDELFLVHRGTLLMRFRDRDVRLNAGEFIIVRRMTEHLPIAETEDCEVILLEPKTTLNTGNVENERTVRVLDRVS